MSTPRELETAAAQSSERRRQGRRALLLALCCAVTPFVTGCATRARYRTANEIVAKNDLPSEGTSSEALFERLGAPDLADHRGGQDIYTWSYINPTLDHPVLIWSPVVGFFFTSVTLRDYDLIVTCRNSTVVAVDTSQTQARAGFSTAP